MQFSPLPLLSTVYHERKKVRDFLITRMERDCENGNFKVSADLSSFQDSLGNHKTFSIQNV